MADQLAIIAGVGVSSFLLFYLSNSFGEGEGDLGRQVLKLLSIGFGVVLLLIVPQTLMVSQVCDVVIGNSTINGALTTYEYTNFCYEETNIAVTGFYKAILIFFRVFVMVLLLRVGWMAVLAFKESAKRRSR